MKKRPTVADTPTPSGEQTLPVPHGNNPVTIDTSKVTGALSPMPEPVEGSAITPVRVWMHRLSRFNPIRNLQPSLLVQQVEQFDIGTLSPFARTMEKIAEVDDAIKSGIMKRKASVSRMGYKIIVDPDIEPGQQAEAEEHAEVLRYFYKNLKVTNAIDRDQRGGFSLLVRQMMDALSFKYAVHELLWAPHPGEGLTCTFNYVPLYFFENRLGQMRYLPSDGAYEGVPLMENGWMVSVGDYLMRSCAVCYLYKHTSLKDWVAYNERFGMPLPVIKSKFKKGSPQWEAYMSALQNITSDMGLVMDSEDEIESVVFGNAGTLPHPILIERMDRFISILYRGGDLSTISKGNDSVGANPQQEDASSLEQYDAQFISETLNHWIDPLVIAYAFGEGVKPLAFLKLCAPDRKDITKEIAIDQHLNNLGVDLNKKERLEAYNRQSPDDDAEEHEVIPGRNQNQEGTAGDPNNDGEDKSGESDDDEKANSRKLANERLNRGDATQMALLRNARTRVSEAEAAALEPLWERLDGLMQILDMGDEKAFRLAAEKFVADIPEIQKEISRDTRGSRAFEAVNWSALLNGLTEGHVARN